MSSSGEEPTEEILLLVWLHVNAHFIAVFAKKQYMVSEYKRDLAVKFKDSMQTPDEESTERAELLLILKHHFTVGNLNIVVGREFVYEILQMQVLRFA